MNYKTTDYNETVRTLLQLISMKILLTVVLPGDLAPLPSFCVPSLGFAIQLLSYRLNLTLRSQSIFDRLVVRLSLYFNLVSAAYKRRHKVNSSIHF